MNVVNVAIDTVLRQCQRTCGWTYRRTDVRYEIRGRMKWSVVKRKETHLQWYLCSRSVQQRQWQNMPTEPNSIPWFRLERKKKEIEIRKRKASRKKKKPVVRLAGKWRVGLVFQGSLFRERRKEISFLQPRTKVFVHLSTQISPFSDRIILKIISYLLWKIFHMPPSSLL